MIFQYIFYTKNFSKYLRILFDYTRIGNHINNPIHLMFYCMF